MICLLGLKHTARAMQHRVTLRVQNLLTRVSFCNAKHTARVKNSVSAAYPKYFWFAPNVNKADETLPLVCFDAKRE
mgnify:CR=1 FL=1